MTTDYTNCCICCGTEYEKHVLDWMGLVLCEKCRNRVDDRYNQLCRAAKFKVLAEISEEMNEA